MILLTILAWLTLQIYLNQLQDYLNNPGAQEKCMRESLNVSCQYLRKKGAITSSTSQDRIAGLLMVSHLLGDGSAEKYALGQSGGLTQDANGTTAGSYYASGSGAVKKLG